MEGKYEGVAVSSTHHIADEKQAATIQGRWPKKLAPIRNGKVFGQLNATRSLGNTWLKQEKIAVHAKDTDHGFKESIKGFPKALILSEPEISVFQISECDRWLVLATDGVFTYLKRR